MNIWVVTMEYAGILEAGGVKNVACSLAESLVDCGCDVTIFMPFFGCATTDKITDLNDSGFETSKIDICKKKYNVSYKTGKIGNIKLVFVAHDIFAEKNNVYTYTEEDEKKNPLHKKGNGFEDARLVETLFLKGVSSYGTLAANDSHIFRPDIILCHDAATACLPAYIHNNSDTDFFRNTKCAVTIHNAGPAYHHEFASVDEAVSYTSLPKELISKAKNIKRVEPFLLASESGAVLTTVSKEYARELEDISNNEATDGLSSLFASKKIRITGITNGIDFERYNPTDTKKSLLPFAYNSEKKDISGKYDCRKFFLENFAAKKIFPKKTDSFSKITTTSNNEQDYLTGISRSGYISNENERAVYFAYHGRVVTQKGIDVLVSAAKIVLQKNKDAYFVIVGQGEERMEEEIAQLAEEFAGRVIFFKGYNKAMAHLAVAICDYIILPSIFEPCGLEDLIAQIFGTLPIAHATGGLKKIVDGTTGFLYKPNDAKTLSKKILQMIDFKHNERKKFDEMIFAATSHVHHKYSWKEIAEKKYLPLFEKMLSGKQK